MAEREFNNPMDEHVVKVIKGDKTVMHLPCEFCRIVWYFLGRSGEIIVVDNIVSNCAEEWRFHAS